jgi:two-component sensor histidine kinase
MPFLPQPYRAPADLRLSAARPQALTFLAGGGEMGELIRRFDWTGTPLGAPERWPGSLRTLVQVMLTSQQPMFIAWGAERTMLYNDGYAPMCTNRHPWALGKPFNEVWSDIIGSVGPIMDKAYQGQPTYMDDIEFHMLRHGELVETHFSFGYTPVHDETDQIAGMFCTALEITAEVKQARARTAEAQRLRDMLEKAPSFMAVLSGPEHVFEVTNAAYMQLIGHRDVIGKTAREALPEVAGQGFFELLDQVYTTGEAFIGRSLDIDLQRVPGGPVQKAFLDFIYQPMKDDSGHVTGIFVEGSDVSYRKEAEAQQQMLSAELQHRVKNTLAMVSAIALQTLRGDDIAERRQNFSARLEALAQAHDLLTVKTWQSAAIRSVVDAALAPHLSGDHRFIVQGEDIELNARQALSMSLTIHELATNAAKYGAMSTPSGTVSISWQADPTNGQWLFTWQESGGPTVAVPGRTGFGTRLITRALAADFGGEVELQYWPEGVHCTLRAPLSTLVDKNPTYRTAASTA